MNYLHAQVKNTAAKGLTEPWKLPLANFESTNLQVCNDAVVYDIVYSILKFPVFLRVISL